MGLAGLWGIAGVLALLGQAIAKLAPLAWQLKDLELGVLEIGVLIGWVAINAYSEGYRGFHRMFSPRVVARARCLDARPRPLHVVLAPLYCMGMIHATRKRMIISWTLTLAIVGIVVAVRHLDQPWRGIVDAGVVVGLGIGVVSILYFVAQAIAGRAVDVEPDLPAGS